MNRHYIYSLILVLTAGLGGCVIDNDENDDKKALFVPSQKTAIINTVADDYSESDVELVAFKDDTDDEPLLAVAANHATGLSDFSLANYGEYYYRIGRFGIDTVSKYAISNTGTEVYSYSTLDAPSDLSSNPYQLVFASATKAYLLRYNSTKVWVVNPEASSQAGFKIGEIDLAHYADSDGTPEISTGIIVDGKLYIVMERLESWTVVAGNAYLAVIDTSTDTEIDTTPLDAADLPGIQLQTSNPAAIVYHKDVGLLVQAVGSYGSAPNYTPGYSGGIEKISTVDYSTSILVDDGDSSNHPYGLISGLAVVSATQAYFIGYNGWQNSALYQFNPASGSVESTVVAGLHSLDLRGIAVSPGNGLWVSVADSSNPRVLVIDPDDNAVKHVIETTFNPTSVVFAEAE